ncbi:MAG: hypothetical protein IVW36_04895 [Dehalococcoidia bacterium]|nr:hypothetical protein [Dehalococcoidia bacterium]
MVIRIGGGLAVVVLATLLAACSGSGGVQPKTPAPTAARAPSVAEISALVGQGFVGETIPDSATLVSAFTDPVAVINEVKLCGAPANTEQARSADYWPVLLGQCYFAGNATMRLYQFTNRSEFLDANRLLERLHRARLDEARADGAAIGERYWQVVTKAIYDPAFTPVSPTAAPAAAR